MISQSNAKQFFVNKILNNSVVNKVVLSGSEKYMLKWSESDKDFEIKQDIIDKFNETTTEEVFEEN